MITAILFDLDGLLADTEPLNIAVAIKVCRGLGFDLTAAEQKDCIGVTNRKFYTDLLKHKKITTSTSKVLNLHFLAYERLLKTKARPFPSTYSLLKKLKRLGYKLGLVSGSTNRQINIILKTLGLTGYFDTIVSADEIKRSKPDPEGYLKAARNLSVNPQQCLVLEDSQTGVVAAKAANMKVVGIINRGGQNLSLADKVYPNLLQFKLTSLSRFHAH